MKRGTKNLLKVMVIMACMGAGASLGTHMHNVVGLHDASLRTPGELQERWKATMIEHCQRTESPDQCALERGIVI